MKGARLMLRNYAIFSLLIVMVKKVASFDVSHVPSLDPLKYITPDVISSYYLRFAEDALWSSVLPVDQQDATAIFISEGVSGFIAGAAAKATAIINGNKNNKESSLINAELSATYFGVAGACRSIAQLAGLSSILVNISALLFGFAFSEIIKIRSRTIEPARARVGKGPSMYELMRFKNPSMFDLMRFKRNEDNDLVPRMKMSREITRTEILADLTKYFFIYSLVPRTGNYNQKLEQSVYIGIFAGIVSQAVREKQDKNLESELANYSKAVLKKSRQRLQELSPIFVEDKKKKNYYTNKNIIKTKKKEEKYKPPVVKVLKKPPEARIKRDFVLTRYARSAVETAVQLLTYEAARQYVMEVAPYFQQGEITTIIQELK